MADPNHVAKLKKGVTPWNRWRAETNHAAVDLSGAELSGLKLIEADLLRANLSGATLSRAQLERAHLKDADLTAAVLDRANLKHVNAREAIFDGVVAKEANFEVATLRGARFRKAQLPGARFHRTYLRDADLRGADLTDGWLRFATLDGAWCEGTRFTGADLCYASMVETNLKGADLTDVQVFGISAWSVVTDADTRQDLIVCADRAPGNAPLRAHDLQTAQLLALMLDGVGVRRVLDSVGSKLVLILGSFAPEEKPVLDALRAGLQGCGYVAVTFDFDRPSDRDYAETVVILAGMSRFVIADFTNAKEVRAEVAQAHAQYRRVPIIPIAKEGAPLPVTMVNTFSQEELDLLVRYATIGDLLDKLPTAILEPAEARVSRIAAGLAKAESLLRGPQ